MHAYEPVIEPSREISVVDDVDVVVAGGGPAGIAAALSAAREGARVVLVERFGYLGGMITGASVVAVLGVGDGYKPLAGGVTEEIRKRLADLGGVDVWREGSSQDVSEQLQQRHSGEYKVDPELFKWQTAEMLLEANVKLRLHTMACAPILEGQQVLGVITESKSGRQAIRARVTIDATADADLAARAGVGFVNETHEVTLSLDVGDVDWGRVEAFRQEKPLEYEAAMEEAKRLNGGYPLGRRLLKHIDVSDAMDLTHAEIKLRRESFAALMYLREHVPGYEAARIIITYPQLGVRQGRRIHGEYTLADEDLRNSRHFDDGIARLGVYFPDWGPIYQIKGLAYDIPYRCLVPRGIDGLLVVGRSISCDYRACNTMRLIVPCLATGQAAGVAAALAVELGTPPRQVPSAPLRRSLKRQCVYLG